MVIAVLKFMGQTYNNLMKPGTTPRRRIAFFHTDAAHNLESRFFWIRLDQTKSYKDSPSINAA